MSFLKRSLRDIKQYPSAIVGLVFISSLFLIAAYALITIPYGEAIRLWGGSDGVWLTTPRNAPPKWINWFRSDKLPETIVVRSQEAPENKEIISYGDGFSEIRLVQELEFNYDHFPSELSLFFTAQFEEFGPHVEMSWITPDGREIRLTEMGVKHTDTYRISQDTAVRARVGGRVPEVGLFADPSAQGNPVPLKGTYQLVVEGFLFEDGSDLDTELVAFGKVHGVAGTDHRRRDITVALLWGAPVALTFGVVAAMGTSVITMALAAIAVWFGGIIDWVIHRITQVNLTLPTIPILLMVGTFMSKSIWVILGVLVLLNIFGSGILSFRSMFLQVKESGYIEAARSYGASNMRIIFRYMIPKIIPVLVPQFVIQVPSFVFIEATLAVLGLGDPVLPTWGKLLHDAYSQGALYTGHYYWVLEPAGILVIFGFGFALLGFALDRVFNPRLRGL